MSTHNYTRALVDGEWDTDLALLSKEIETALPAKTFRLKADGASVDAVFDATLTAGEITTLDTAVSDHQAAHDPLPAIKSKKIAEIDARTVELIAAGFEYPAASGNIFSLAQNSQINLLGIDLSRNDPALTYPINYNTIDDAGVYGIVDATDAHSMYLSALGAKRSALDGGTSLKDQVRAATTVTEVDAIVDSR